MNTREFCELLGIEHSIIQAPMAGGTTTPELVAAVSNAGALGSLGAAYQTPEQMREAIAEIRRRTDRPFNVNLFIGGRETGAGRDPSALLDFLAPYHRELGLSAPTAPQPTPDPFEAQVEVVLETKPRVFSFTFGMPSTSALAALQARGILVVGTATTVEEARQLEAVGVDAVAAQGAEAGGHRGTFAGSFEEGLVGTMALVPQIVDAVRIPVIAAGGIMDGRGIVAAQALGAVAVQMGTAFLACSESGASAVYKAALRAGREDKTAITRAFSGRPARALVNELLLAFRNREEVILPFPLHNTALQPLRKEAARRGDTRFVAMYAGQAARLTRDLPAADLVRQLVQEAEDVVGKLEILPR